MSEQKGSYAHVGLPGLGQLFAYVNGRAMEEEKRDLEADLKVLTIIPKDPSEPVNMVHDVVAPHALRRAIEAERQLTEKDEENKQLMSIAEDWQRQYVQAEGVIREKDATIKKFEDDALYWYRETEKTRSMYLAAHDEKVGLRKALEEARNVMEDALSVGEARHKSFDQALCPWCDLIMGVESINRAIGEGDKE